MLLSLHVKLTMILSHPQRRVVPGDHNMEKDAKLAASARGLLLGLMLGAGMWTAGITAVWRLML